MTTTPPHELEGLSEKDCLSLFFKCAFGDEKQVVRYPELEGIGKVIVRKCGGVPLALKTLGSLLYNTKAETDWIRVRDNEIWELEREHGQILPALRLSYNAMSPSLKECFAYCSTFHEDAEMNSFELILIWMALGVIQSRNEETELEDIGQFLFKELWSRAFFQCDDDSDDDDSNYGFAYDCSMHDLIHDLTRSITESECHIIKSGKENIPESTMRHLIIFFNGNDLTVLKRFYKLWSIYIDCTAEDCNIDEFFLSTCIKQLRYLRVFDLQGLSFDVLPITIGTLKHLSYLNLSENTKIKRLPNSICKLQNLQTLLLDGCQELEELPRGIRRLVSLRTLTVTTNQEYIPKNGIGCLKSLRTLGLIGCENLRFLSHDMRNCTSLRTLSIGNCEQLDLAIKSHEVVISKMSLQRLFISNLPQMTALPQWLTGASHTLKHLVIERCNQLVALPEWLPNLVSLQKLIIKECEELLGLPDGMECLTALTYLEIEDCEQLHLTSGRDGPAMHLKLQTVKIEDLPQAMALPNWLRAAHTLQYLYIYNCPKLDALPEWLPDLTSLKSIEISECQRLSSLPEGMSRLTSLTDLEITDSSASFYERYQPEIGKAWANIAHIPNVYITPISLFVPESIDDYEEADEVEVD